MRGKFIEKNEVGEAECVFYYHPLIAWIVGHDIRFVQQYFDGHLSTVWERKGGGWAGTFWDSLCVDLERAHLQAKRYAKHQEAS